MALGGMGVLGLGLGGGASAQIIETGPGRVATEIDPRLPVIGSVRPRSTREITGSNWLIGCETLDRDFADYDAYKEFIEPLGIHRLRMQAGWSKTEKVRGQYDFAWLDHIVNDAAARGLKPWLQTSYGNELYPGGGGTNLGAGLPKSREALAAFGRWVEAMVTRYRDKVVDWEVWNEPNFADNLINSPEETADFNVMVARIIKRVQPQARISGLALGHYNEQFVERFFARVAQLRGFPLFDTMTYHDYVYNPDGNVHQVLKLRAQLEKHDRRVRLRQGENGAPSAGGPGRGALGRYPWSELTQAKWDTRRMLGNLALDIECSIFGLVEMAYTSGPIHRMNYKGILKSDASKRVIRPKTAYYAIQHVTSIFDDQLARIDPLLRTHTIESIAANANGIHIGNDRDIAVSGYRHRKSGLDAYTLWFADNIPAEGNAVSMEQISIAGAEIADPVWVDIITGGVHQVPAANWKKDGRILRFRDIPVYDAPIVLADRSLIALS
jgi:hypothetical protein